MCFPLRKLPTGTQLPGAHQPFRTRLQKLWILPGMLLGSESCSPTKAHPNGNSCCCQFQLGTAWCSHRGSGQSHSLTPQPCICYSASCPACSGFPAPRFSLQLHFGSASGELKVLLLLQASHSAPGVSFLWHSGFLIQLLQSFAPVIPASRNSLRASRFGCWLSSWIFHLPKSPVLLVKAFKK